MNSTSASIGKRLVAMLLDILFISTFVAIMSLPFAIISYVAYSWALSVLSFLVFIFYFAIFEGCATRASLGKMIVHIKVVTQEDNRIGFGRAFVRALVFYIISIPDIIVGLATSDNRSLHDIMTSTCVVNKNAAVIVPPSVKAAPSIVCLSGVYAGCSFNVENGVIIGTDPTVCQIVIPSMNTGVSRNHCKVSFDHQSNMFIIHDLGSTNGTFLWNGQPIPQGAPYAVTPGTKFFLATQGNSFEVKL